MVVMDKMKAGKYFERGEEDQSDGGDERVSGAERVEKCALPPSGVADTVPP